MMCKCGRFFFYETSLSRKDLNRRKMKLKVGGLIFHVGLLFWRVVRAFFSKMHFEKEFR